MKSLKGVMDMRTTQQRDNKNQFMQLGAETLPTQNLIIIIIM